MSSRTEEPQIKFIDIYAKEAAGVSHEISDIPFTCDEAKLLVDSWVWDKWKVYWSTNETCSYQSVFSSPTTYSHNHGSRIRNTIVYRIRLQQTRLNSGLFKIGLHADGLCPTCKVKQDGFHLLMSCDSTKELRSKIKETLHKENLFNFKYLLSDPKIMDIVLDYIIKNKIEV